MLPCLWHNDRKFQRNVAINSKNAVYLCSVTFPIGCTYQKPHETKVKSKNMLYDMFYCLVGIEKNGYICSVILKTIFLP